MGEDEDQPPTEAWADILARQSPEGRALVLLLNQAEQTAVEAQLDAMRVIDAGLPVTFDALEAAITEVTRLRKEVYRMVRQ